MCLERLLVDKPRRYNSLHFTHPPFRPPNLIFYLSSHPSVSHPTKRHTATHRCSTRLQLRKGWVLDGGNDSTTLQRAKKDEEDDMEEEDGDSQDLLGEEGEGDSTIIIDGVDDEDAMIMKIIAIRVSTTIGQRP